MPDTRPPALDDQLCYAIYSAGIAIQRAYKPLLDGLGLTYPQYLVLTVLWERGPQPIGAIVQRLEMDYGTISPLVKRLESHGLVRRVRSAQDARQVEVALTADGDRLRAVLERPDRQRAPLVGEQVQHVAARAHRRVDVARSAAVGEVGGGAHERDSTPREPGALDGN